MKPSAADMLSASWIWRDRLAPAGILGLSPLKVVMTYCHTQESHTASCYPQKVRAARKRQSSPRY